MANTDPINFSSNPKNKHLAEIKRWLLLEEKKTGDGFFCNWDNIESSFDENKLLIVTQNEKTIGFANWHSSDDFLATIDVVEIHPDFRGKGICREFLSFMFSYFRERNVYVVDLQCAPASSESIWRKLGFIDFLSSRSISHWENGNKKLYQTLIPISNPTSKENNCEFIELWDDEPHMAKDIDAMWFWKLDFENGTRHLAKPIVHPSHYDWNIKWGKNGLSIKEDKIKYLRKDKIIFGKFLIITDMPPL